jgi:hypothetical protein
MKAQLTDGTIVALPKDCQCTHHDGPHWLHMAEVQRRLNYAAWRPTMTEVETHHLAASEIARLHEKAAHMERLGIAQIIREDDGQ